MPTVTVDGNNNVYSLHHQLRDIHKPKFQQFVLEIKGQGQKGKEHKLRHSITKCVTP